jgi:curved DNA-binding protein CbpA
MVNYYKILKVSPKASTAEIKSAYRRLARKLHPDVNGGSEQAAEGFAIIAKAYEVLSNPDERAFFDRKLSQSNGSIHTTDSVFHSDNSHAQRLRQMAFERRYNEIIDRMIEEDRKETLALQKFIFPIVALFVSTFAVAVFKPSFWSNSAIIGKIILFALFAVGILRLIKTLKTGFDKFTYTETNLHESILDEEDEDAPHKPYSRTKAAICLAGLFALCLTLGLLLGNYLTMFTSMMMHQSNSPGIKLEMIFYPPIVVLLVEIVHSIVIKFEH